ncbi:MULTISPECIES: hypothetical protein [unclassified Colwellia]|uniref:hypothetical protein n=1 Tax=unclassified Colwellia TaxID=196834 RepID=UPI0015F3D733|nr:MULTISPECIES: hypothetical protein [unclassified Colwellia]MBA6230996.1 hypothetical protein [Colwellia sp. MB02u-7]MBA6234927.1 hypothetical protein [Colwellia sp. MB02u-11]MBA6301482.1 hypothetical protein [Colwellia sp. MB3u-22]MBA6312783.1 hypothetical protein [Colwellia sp. MB3u-64]
MFLFTSKSAFSVELIEKCGIFTTGPHGKVGSTETICWFEPVGGTGGTGGVGGRSDTGNTGGTGGVNNKETSITQCKRAALVAKHDEYAFIDKISVANGFLCLALRLKPLVYACEAATVLTRDIDRRSADEDFFDANAKCK